MTSRLKIAKNASPMERLPRLSSKGIATRVSGSLSAARATQAYREPEAPREPPPAAAGEEDEARAAATLDESDFAAAETVARRPRWDASDEAQPAAPKKAQNSHSPDFFFFF